MIISDEHIRTAVINRIDVVNVSLSGVVQIGDTASINAVLRALAVQRQMDHSIGGDVYFAHHPLFSAKVPTLSEPPDDLNVSVQTCNVTRRIDVGTIRTLAVGSSAVLLAGNAMNMTGDSRIKHFRQFSNSIPTTLTNPY